MLDKHEELELTISQSRRRVSAPSDPPSSTQEIQDNRSRRVRHWRVRKGAPGDSGSGLGSNVSTLGSYGTSTDDTTSYAGPTTSPAAGLPKSSTSIRFAPGS